MSTLENSFFSKLKENCNKNISFIDEVAGILDINYDAAYRRIKNKTTLSLSDAIKLANHFNVSLDNLLDRSLYDKRLIVSYSDENLLFDQFENYYKTILQNFTPLHDKKDVNLIYQAKDLPLFYFSRDSLFLKFKTYLALYLLDKDFSKKNVNFDSFNIPIRLEYLIKQFGEIYYNLDITEVWNDSVLEGIIRQIHYFYEIKLLSYNTALKLCDKLKDIIKQIEIDSFNGYRNNKTLSKFNLYSTPILPLTNNVVIKTSVKNIFISPYNFINYFTTIDQKFVNKYIQFIENQLENSTLLSKTGVKQRILFFKPFYKTIEKAKQHIELIRQFPIWIVSIMSL